MVQGELAHETRLVVVEEGPLKVFHLECEVAQEVYNLAKKFEVIEVYAPGEHTDQI